MAILEAFTYNGERDILRLHLEMLHNYVDKFIICEAKTTFTGYKKPLYFFQHQRYFKKWWSKIEYYVIDENYTDEEINLARESPYTKGAAHWRNEFLQKESIKKGIEVLKPNPHDLIYIGDVDEIINPDSAILVPSKIKLRVFADYLNNESSEEFWGPIAVLYKDLKGKSLNELRNTLPKSKEYGGWHFTNMGGIQQVRRKLNDSYTSESYNTYEVQEKLSSRLQEGTDYLGRPFTFKVNEENWPQYLKENKREYKHLLWQQ